MNELSPLVSFESFGRLPRSDIDHEDELQHEIAQRAISKTFYATLSNSLAFGAVGLVYVSVYVNLSLIATKVGTDSIDIGSIFIGPAVGGIIGCLSWPVLSHLMAGGYSILLCLSGLIATFIGISMCSMLSILYILFFCVGLFGACLSTGSFAMIRNLQRGEDVCGPWFSGAAILYLAMGMVGVLLNYFLDNVTYICLCVSFVLSSIVLFNISFQHFEPLVAGQGFVSVINDGINISRYSVEIVCGLVLGALNGCNSAILAYLESYTEESTTLSGDSYATIVYWLAVIVGLNIMLFIQNKCNTARLLAIHTLSALLMIFLSLFLCVLDDSVIYFWFAIGLIGCCLGVTLSACMDLVNRLSNHSDVSTTIIFIFFNLLTYLVVYFVSVVWEYSSVEGDSLFYTVMVVSGLSLVILMVPSLQFRRQYFDDLL